MGDENHPWAQPVRAVTVPTFWMTKVEVTVEQYEECFQLLKTTNKSGILGIGDSYTTDIKGANLAGLDALLVAGGIHGSDLIHTSGNLDGSRTGERAKAEGVHLIGVVEAFVW